MRHSLTLALLIGVGALATTGSALAVCIENTTDFEVWAWFAPDDQGEAEILDAGQALCHDDYSGPVQVALYNDTNPSYGSVEVEEGGRVVITDDQLSTIDAGGEITYEAAIGGNTTN